MLTSPFLELFARSCVDRPEVMAEGPNYVTALLSEFCAPMLVPFGVAAIKV